LVTQLGALVQEWLQLYHILFQGWAGGLVALLRCVLVVEWVFL